MKIVIYSLVLSVLFLGCSSKQYFEPEIVDGNYDVEILDIDSSIVDFSPDGITLENNDFISKSGIVEMNGSEHYRFINEVDGVILASDDNSTLLLKSNNKIEKINFDKNIVSASKKDDIIALGFIDNSIAIYNKKTKTTVFNSTLLNLLLMI